MDRLIALVGGWKGAVIAATIILALTTAGVLLWPDDGITPSSVETAAIPPAVAAPAPISDLEVLSTPIPTPTPAPKPLETPAPTPTPMPAEPETAPTSIPTRQPKVLVFTGRADLSGYIDPITGMMRQTIEVRSTDGNGRVVIQEGTTATDAAGKPLSEITVTLPDTSVPKPRDSRMIVLYDFGPDGAHFSPSIPLAVTYNPALIPAGTAIKDLALSYYDATAHRWIALASNTGNDGQPIISSETSHFTPFAILSPQAPGSITACDASGMTVDIFLAGQTVYITGTHLAKGNYTVWIQPGEIADGTMQASNQDPSLTQESVTVEDDGNLPITPIWSSSWSMMPLTTYSIVLDNQETGLANSYDAESDYSDSAGMIGYDPYFIQPTPPVPELPTILLLSLGLIGPGIYLWWRRRQSAVIASLQ